MSRISDECKHILDTIIQELLDDPIDLLSNGDGLGETAYLENARYSYYRTVSDILINCDKFGGERKNIRILEIGSFLGVVSCTLAQLGFSVSALDIPEFMKNERLKIRYGRDGVSTIAADLRNYFVPAEPEHFTIVVMCETLEHLNFNPLPVMAEVNRVLIAGGYLYLSLPNQASLVNRLKLFFGRSIHNPVSDFVVQLGRESNMIVGIHWREYTAVELEDLLTVGGFSIIKHDFFTTHLASIPARVLYTFFPRLRANQTVVACKVLEASSDFSFCEATR